MSVESPAHDLLHDAVGGLRVRTAVQAVTDVFGDPDDVPLGIHCRWRRQPAEAQPVDVLEIQAERNVSLRGGKPMVPGATPQTGWTLALDLQQDARRRLIGPAGAHPVAQELLRPDDAALGIGEGRTDRRRSTLRYTASSSVRKREVSFLGGNGRFRPEIAPR